MALNARVLLLLYFLSLCTVHNAYKNTELEDENLNLESEEKEEEDFPCLCHFSIHPVCGVDGQTYPNRCFIGCKKVKVAHAGLCDGRRRSLARSASQSTLDGVEEEEEEEEEPKESPCKRCSWKWDPVCTEIGVTYYNSCWADCRNYKYTWGECP